jgi:23S rRNA pseudouridine1911/1915/1917 synthase
MGQPSKEYYPMIAKITVHDLTENTRADKFIALKFTDISRVQIKKSFDGGRIICNGRLIKPKCILKNGDALEIDLILPTPTAISPHKMELEILFEDEYMVIVNKPAGISVHAGNGVREPTLVEGVLSHCELSRIGGEHRPGVVHRLDKYTTGAIIFAKTDAAYLKLIKLFATRAIHKEYLSIVCGAMPTLSGTINQPIGRHKIVKTKMCVRPDGRPAATDWELQKRFGTIFSLLKIIPHTGRTHQIRVHMSSIGHPVVGDTTYGYRQNFHQTIQCSHPILHANRLSFLHPVTAHGMQVEACIPENFTRVIDSIEQAIQT